jgi:hypothetical protein
MSEEDTSFSDIDEEEKQEGLESDLDTNESVDSIVQPGLEQEKEEEDEEEEEEEEEEPTTVGGRDEDEDEDEEELEVVEIEEEPRPVSRRSQRRKRAKVKEPEPSVANIEKQLEKQANNLTRLEQELQPLRKLAKSSEMQSKVIKDINSSVKQLGKQIIQIQKAIQKDKRKGTGVEKVKTRSKSKPKLKSKGKGRSRRK